MKKYLIPISLPVLYFLITILMGACVLCAHLSCAPSNRVSFIDALFISTSAVCVTGLSVVDIGTTFNTTGQIVIMVLIQLGGLGIMTFTTLALYLLNKRVSLMDRLAVGQTILHNPAFHIGEFLWKIVKITFLIELCGAVCLFVFTHGRFTIFSSLFHAVSAFCNAGFSLFSSNLLDFRGNIAVNLIIAVLIILGGIGFGVLIECQTYLAQIRYRQNRYRLSWQTRLILNTTLALIAIGTIYIYLSEFVFYGHGMPLKQALLSSFFQSVTCRTAGFNTLDIQTMTNTSLTFMIFLMFVGGAPGSCAGGIKITTFRVLSSFVLSQFKGTEQVVLNKYAIDRETINKAISLLFFAILIIFFATVILDFSEGGDVSHMVARGRFLEILFEVVSAFGTVGLSLGLTAHLTALGKMVIIVLMFIGRLGPLLLIAMVQVVREKVFYRRPEENLPIG